MKKIISAIVLIGGGALLIASTQAFWKQGNTPYQKKTHKTLIKTDLKVSAPETNLKNKKYTPENYKIIHKDVFFKQRYYRAIRSFSSEGIEYLLAVDLETNHTKVLPTKSVTITTNKKAYNQSTYKKTLDRLATSTGLANTGIGHATSLSVNTQYMTVDMCPSSKTGFSKSLFTDFIANGHKNIAIAITNKWIDTHEDSFQWLLDKQNEGLLNITWINHTSDHPYKFGKPLAKNFILLPNVDLETEILSVEKQLLTYGQVPSVFIRFPGLISNKTIRKKVLNKFGLVFVGADSWLAKGEIPHDGSIILVHGNKNEPKGIEKARILLKNQKTVSFGVLEAAF